MCRSIGIIKQSKTQGQNYSAVLGTSMYNTNVFGLLSVSVKQLPHGWSNQKLKISVIDVQCHLLLELGITIYLYVNQCLALLREQ